MNPIYNLLVYIVWFLATYYTTFFFLSLLTHKPMISINPLVTFIIPAYNEEMDIAETIASLKKLTYDKAEFIVINDGSIDSTSQIVKQSIAGDCRFRFMDNKDNQGKANRLNQGIKKAHGEIVCCMDADSIIEPGIIQKILPYFTDSKVGAVTVSVQVKNPKKWLHRIIDLEFTLGLSLFLKIFSFFDCVFVTPGPFSAYRKKVLVDIGGYDPQNVTEDHEIAFRLHKGKYKIKNCIEAKVYTALPETFKGIYIQRRRWYSGAIQTIFQHRDMVFNKKYGLFGFFMPYNYTLIALGLILFAASTFLAATNSLESILYFRYTNFNFFEHFTLDLDILNYGRVNILGLGLFTATCTLMLLGLRFTHKKYREHKLGLLGYPLLFFLYQIYWGGALIAVLRRKKIKWR